MNKVTVTRKVPVDGQPRFEVRLNGELKRLFVFEIGQSETSIYNEDKNRLRALEIAKEIEAGLEASEDIIYETPTPQQP